ncbi:ComF family protein [Oecophyllibacter saccharovorans]|uniref:ComF family protein n=2 Tax=Oecophyllibacter saccharovorans TaxID=2558360 RepID=A0A506UQU9_9PROT|nr:ComF family protein [Oecophyllibacter saccharovorans]
MHAGKSFRAVVQAVLRWRESLADLLWPPVCLGCGVETQGPARAFCAACFGKLHRIVDPFCQRCGEPLAFAALGGAGSASAETSDFRSDFRKVPEKDDGFLCSLCQRQPPLWNRARAAFVYDQAARQLILPFKYSTRLENRYPLAHAMGQAGADLLEGEPVLIPVPLHARKLRRRGYNQAALLARELTRSETGRKGRAVLAVDALQRHRQTRPLARLSRSERHREMQGVIGVRKRWVASLAGQRVVLVDDVLTTGATAEACVQALHAIGCREVDILVAARAVGVEDSAGHYPFFQEG